MSDSKRFTKRLILIYIIISIALFQQGVDFQMMMYMYYPPKHICKPPNISGVVVKDDNCKYSLNQNGSVTTYNCLAWDFDRSQIHSNLVTELSLVCQYQYLQLMIIPLRQFSSIFNLILAVLSDTRGRKIMFLVSIFADSFLWILLGIVSTNYVSHIILRCLKGAVSSAPTIGFVLVSEITPTKYRNLITINYWSAFSVGLAVAPFYMWMTHDWRSAWLLSFIPNIIFLVAPFVMIESPQWLITNNRAEEGYDVSEKLNLHFVEEMRENKAEEKYDKPQTRFSDELKSFMLSYTLISRLFVLLFTSFAFYFVYQALSTNITFASSNIYLNAFLVGLIEIPSGPLSSLGSEYFGSVFITIFQTFLALIFYVVYNSLWMALPASNLTGYYAKLVLACLIRFMISGAWNVQGIFYVTLIPTTVRNFFNNFGEVFGKFGAAFGGLVGYYIAEDYLMSGTIYGLSLFSIVILVGFIIPSSKNEPLPQTVNESLMIKKDFQCGNSSLKT